MPSAASDAAMHPNQPAPGRALNGRAMSSLISRSAGDPSTHTGRDARVGIILTGGNVDLDRLPWQ